MITIRYTCKKCGLVDQQLQVPARATLDDDVKDWIELVVASCINDDHRTRSPACNAKNMTNLKIPVEKSTEFIGQQVE